MDVANCSIRSPSDLDGLEQLPGEDLVRLVHQCVNICEIIAGYGNPDLLGIGVLLSYLIQFALALVYGPHLFISVHVFPPSPESRPRYQLNEWLLKQQDIALWSQLLYTLTIVLACFVRRHQTTLQAYEGGMILYVISLNIACALLTWVAYLRQIKRRILFVAVVVSIAALSISAQSSPAAEQQRHWNVIEACLDNFVIRIPFDKRIPALAGLSTLALLVALAWFYLYYRAPNEGEKSLIHPKGSLTTRMCVWIATGYILFSISVLVALGSTMIYFMFLCRSLFTQKLPAAAEQWQENVWGLGQIIAPFAWAPLLIELGDAIINTVIGKRPKEQTRESDPDMGLDIT